MATVKNGVLTPPGEWWKHLRWTKRMFWKGERQAGKKEAQFQDAESDRRQVSQSPDR